MDILKDRQPVSYTNANTGSAQSSAGRRTVAVVFLYFVIAGVGTVMLGPALPLLAVRWGLPDAQLGTLFMASFFGQLCGSWLAARRLGISLLLGSLGAAAGLIVLAFAGATVAHLALFCIGLGLGAGLTAGNVIVGTIGLDEAPASLPKGRGTSRSRLLALLNVSWGVGAIACPLLLEATLRIHHSPSSGGRLFFVALAFAFLACAALIAGLLPGVLYRARPADGRGTGVSLRVFSLFAATMVLYVGVENALGGWLPTYAHRFMSASAPAIALCFWVGELTGRGLMALLIRRMNEHLFYRASLVVLIAAAAFLVWTPHLTAVGIFALTAVAALSLAPLFPLAVSFLLARTGNDPGVGRVFAISSLGGTMLPWLTGVVSTHAHSLRLGFAVPAVGAVFMLLLSSVLPGGGKAEMRNPIFHDFTSSDR